MLVWREGMRKEILPGISMKIKKSAKLCLRLMLVRHNYFNCLTCHIEKHSINFLTLLYNYQ